MPVGKASVSVAGYRAKLPRQCLPDLRQPYGVGPDGEILLGINTSDSIVKAKERKRVAILTSGKQWLVHSLGRDGKCPKCR